MSEQHQQQQKKESNNAVKEDINKKLDQLEKEFQVILSLLSYTINSSSCLSHAFYLHFPQKQTHLQIYPPIHPFIKGELVGQPQHVNQLFSYDSIQSIQERNETEDQGENGEQQHGNEGGENQHKKSHSPYVDPHAESPPREKYKLNSGEKTMSRSPTGQGRRHANSRKANRFMRNSSLAFVEGEEEVEFMRTKNGYVRTLQEIAREREIHDRTSAKRKSFRQVTPINTDMVQDVCRSVNSKLSLKKITIDQLLNNYIFVEPIKSKGTISVKALVEIFCKEPFNLTQEDSENLGRYLIEDNTQDTIKYRLNMEAENSLVRSRARFIIGNIRIFKPEEEIDLQRQLATIMKKHGDNLYTQLILNNDVKKSLMAYKEQVLKAMQYLDLDMSKPQSEYYFLRLFERSNDPNRFKLDDCCKLFNQYYEA